MNEQVRISISLTGSARLVRRIERVLEQEGERESLVALLHAWLHAHPEDWQSWLRCYDILLHDGDEVAAGDVANQMLAAATTASDLRRIRHLLKQHPRPAIALALEQAQYQANPVDWLAVARYATALHACDHREQARDVLTKQAAADGLTARAGKAVLETLLASGAAELVDIGLYAFAKADPNALAAYLARMPEGKAKELAQSRIEGIVADGWHPAKLWLLRAEDAEAAGHYQDADRLYAQACSARDDVVASSPVSPTPSTWMFRNHPLLEDLIAAIGWYVQRRGTAEVHVAACSTGEEAYSLAIALDLAGLLETCRLSASDVETTLVRRARTGVIEARVARSLPEQLLDRYFHPQRDRRSRLDGRILGRIRFGVADMTQPASSVPPIDVLVANNLLVHLTPELAQRAVAQMCARLTDGGLLCIGGGVHHEGVVQVLARHGMMPITTHAAFIFNSWHLQRHAWYVHPRPYWALPPARMFAGDERRIAALFVTDNEAGHALGRILAQD